MSEEVREVIKDELILDDYSHYYSHAETCGNCGHRNHAYVLKGRPVKGLGVDCLKCGCRVSFTPAFPSA